MGKGRGGGPSVAASHEVNKLLCAAFIATLSSGLLNGTTYACYGKLTTHVSGTVFKAPYYLSEEDGGDRGTTLLGMGLCFFAGAICAGVWTSRPEWKTLLTCARCTILCGVLMCVVAAMLGEHVKQAIYLSAFTSGLQNAMYTTTTGFMRTTHMTGTVTDIGLLLGQAYPHKYNDPAYWWKTRVLSALVLIWMIAGAVIIQIYKKLGTDTAYIPGAVDIAVGCVGLAHCWQEQRRVRAEEVARAEQEAMQKVEVEAKRSSSKYVLGEAKKVPVGWFRLNPAMAALQEVAESLPGNLESIPDFSKVVAQVQNVHRASKLFKRKLSTARQEASEAEVREGSRNLGAVCAFLVGRADTLAALEAAHPGIGAFVAAGAVQGADLQQQGAAQVHPAPDGARSSTEALLAAGRGAAQQPAAAPEAAPRP